MPFYCPIICNISYLHWPGFQIWLKAPRSSTVLCSASPRLWHTFPPGWDLNTPVGVVGDGWPCLYMVMSSLQESIYHLDSKWFERVPAITVFVSHVLHLSQSHQHRPFQTTSIPNVFLAGDWVRGVPHGANGLSQERAYVTGLIAANLVVSRCGDGSQAKIIDTEEDELHVQAAKQAVKQARELVDALGIKSPFL